MSTIRVLEGAWAIEKGGTPDILLTCNGAVMCAIDSRGMLTHHGRSSMVPIDHVEALIAAWREHQVLAKL